MPRITDHPGVTIVKPRKTGYPYQLTFRHPLMDGKPIKRSVSTSDGAKARDFAIELSLILRDPDKWRKLPETTSAEVRRAWEGEVIDNAVNDALEYLQPMWSVDRTPGAKGKADYDTATVIKELREDNRRLAEDNAVLKARNGTLMALLRKFGRDAAEDYTPKTLKRAVQDYLSDDKRVSGTNAGARKKGTLRAWFDRFADALPPSKQVHEVAPREVIDHLAGIEQKLGLERGTVQTIASRLCAMLTHQSHGIFRAQPVKDWLRTHFDDNGEPDAPPYWLEQADVEKMIRKMPGYWGAAAMVQWAGAFRPEELCHLQAANVRWKGEWRVTVAALKNGDEILWKPKTRNSYGDVHLPDFAAATLKKLRKCRCGLLLFPNDKTLHEGTRPRWKKGTFEEKHQLWRADSWTKQYLAHLRRAAKTAELDHERVDGRTLRRSAGKRVLLASKYNIELTAAVLRDTPDTVRKHYAWLLPKDVRQPS